MKKVERGYTRRDCLKVTHEDGTVSLLYESDDEVFVSEGPIEPGEPSGDGWEDVNEHTFDNDPDLCADEEGKLSIRKKH